MVPSGMKLNRLTKTRNSETPITSSGVTSGNSMMKLEAEASRPRQRARPSASSTPSGVAISMVEAGELQALEQRMLQRADSFRSPRSADRRSTSG